MVKAVDFFTNKTSSGDAVSANAYSLTKVLTASAGVLTPLVALLVNRIGKVDFTAWQLVALSLGVLGFLAIAGAADVLARALATWNFTPTNYVQFDEGWPVALKGNGNGTGPARAQVAAEMLCGQGSQFLVVQDGKPPTWVGPEQLNFDLEKLAAAETAKLIKDEVSREVKSALARLPHVLSQ